VSVGDFDYVKPVLEELGELEFCKVKMRPGNPQTLGSIEGVPFFGLPGNPPRRTWASRSSCVRRCATCRGTPLSTVRARARLAHDVKKKQDRRYYLRARVSVVRTTATLRGRAFRQPVLGAAHGGAPGNCLLVLPEGEGFFAAGSEVEVIRLDMEEGSP
jgi:molybdopterin molybdotransferase